jgi:hypothetical protein
MTTMKILGKEKQLALMTFKLMPPKYKSQASPLHPPGQMIHGAVWNTTLTET